MDWGSVVIGVGGLVVAGLSVYLSYRSRTSPYREMIYSKQVEGYAEVMDALTTFYNAVQFFIARQGGRLSEDARLALRSQTAELNDAYHRKHQKWAVFFPEKMNDSLSAFWMLFNGISAPPEVAQQYSADTAHANDPGGLLGDAYTKVFQAAREGLGTEPLSEETLKIIGKIPGS